MHDVAAGSKKELSNKREIFEDIGNRRLNDSERSRDRDRDEERYNEIGSIYSNSRNSAKGADLVAGMGASRGGNGSGIVQKLRSQTQSSSNSRSSSPTRRKSCSKNVEEDRSKVRDTTVSDSAVESRGNNLNSRKCSTGNSNSIDMKSILDDFEGGNTLKRLQKELAESKESLHRSKKAIEDISNSFRREDLGST